MQIPLIDLTRQYRTLEKELAGAIQAVLEGGRYIMGPQVKALEKEIAGYCGAAYGVAVANGTDALGLTLEAAGVGEGDEVITTPYTFFATTEAISRRGAVPVFVDIEPGSYNIDPAQLEARVTPRTKAVVPVHLYGRAADMEPVNAVARRYGLFVLEDACQAIGARYRGRRVGSLAHAACFSFFPTKNLGGYGDGGMIVTDDPALAEKAGMLRLHGGTRKYHHTDLGCNSRLDELQAAVLRVKLQYLDSWNQARRAAAARYDALLAGSGIVTPAAHPDYEPVYHLYIIRLPRRRDAVMSRLREAGIGCAVYYPVPLHLQPVYRSLGYREGDFPEAERAARENLALPLFPEITPAEQERVVETLLAAVAAG